MTQTTIDKVLHIWVANQDDVLACTSQELLDLRAAVRRVHDAEDAVLEAKKSAPGSNAWDQWFDALREKKDADAAIRAEMAGIDGGKEQKP